MNPLIACTQVAFIQGIFRSRLLLGGLRARQTFTQRLKDGVQFAQARVVGLEGTGHFRIGLVRSRALAHLNLVARVQATDGTACCGTDYQLRQLDEATGTSYPVTTACVVFEPGARFAYLEVDLTDNGVSLDTNDDRTWAPTRSFDLHLTVHDLATGALCRHHTGCNESCHVVVVDDDPWPTGSAVESGRKAIYWQYVWQVRRRVSAPSCLCA